MEWAEHVWRAEVSLINKVIGNKLTDERPRCRPRQKWYNRVEKDLKRVNPLLDMSTAQSRDKWKSMLEAMMVLNRRYNPLKKSNTDI